MQQKLTGRNKEDKTTFSGGSGLDHSLLEQFRANLKF